MRPAVSRRTSLMCTARPWWARGRVVSPPRRLMATPLRDLLAHLPGDVPRGIEYPFNAGADGSLDADAARQVPASRHFELHILHSAFTCKGPDMQVRPETLDVVTYGEAMTMFVAAQTGDLARVGQFDKRVAGADLNVAIGLSRLGFKVGWMSRVGDDSFGRYVLDVLAAEGIDARRVTIDERYPTGFQLK